MVSVNKDIRKRLVWVKLYLDTADAGLVCRRCGISRPTLRKWVTRFRERGIDGLKEASRRPKHSPVRKIFDQEENRILQLRTERKLGARRIQNELKRLYNLNLSLATIHKVLKRNTVKPLIRSRKKINARRYVCSIPGERVQLDTCKIAPGLYQYTAVDDCTRYRVLGLYNKRSAPNTLLFIERLLEEMPFPIQRIQTDRGREFFAIEVQERLMSYGIKFRPIKPKSPHLNGKVERSQKTDLDEFYSAVDIKDPRLVELLDEWQHYYNWDRPHGALNGKTPIDRYCELMYQTPLREEIDALYNPTKEHIQEADYRKEMGLRKLK
jgi:transposase InsO family protein